MYSSYPLRPCHPAQLGIWLPHGMPIPQNLNAELHPSSPAKQPQLSCAQYSTTCYAINPCTAVSQQGGRPATSRRVEHPHHVPLSEASQHRCAIFACAAGLLHGAVEVVNRSLTCCIRRTEMVRSTSTQLVDRIRQSSVIWSNQLQWQQRRQPC
jgi:hypothetical protein